MSNNFVIILRGPCGAGKTTTARELEKRLQNTKLIEIDKFKDKMPEAFNKTGDSRAVWFFEAGEEAKKELMKGSNVIIEEAFSFPNLFESTIEKIESGAKIITIEIKFSLEAHLKRNRRKNKVIHTDNEAIGHYRDYIENGHSIINDLSISDPNLNTNAIVDFIIGYLVAQDMIV